MSDLIISVEGLGKRYRIHHEQPVRYKTLRDTIAGGVSRFIKPRSTDQKLKPGDEDFWALKDVSFDIKQGDVVGIIGRNGAGKSTLLKILSRITEPTEGRITLRGRVSSLLEVGTGFHPELTGRENIFLNGAILGMSKAEIRGKFDEIIAFAEVEKFLDTPVKHYSSGMHVRLAFAVAAHLEPEILIVDEVLAVGDAEFQKKCLGKMSAVARSGRTVLFVTHQMEMVDRLTARTIWLAQGRVQATGESKDVVTRYLNEDVKMVHELRHFRTIKQNDTVETEAVLTTDEKGNRQSSFRQGEKIVVVLEVQSHFPGTVDAAVVVENDRDQALFTSHLSDMGKPFVGKGVHRLTVTLDPPVLRRGRYKVCIALFSPDKLTFYEVINHLPLFEVAGTADPSFPDDPRWGDLFIKLRWAHST
jgi:lipopolysaccharide transport system ATP-binding protein